MPKNALAYILYYGLLTFLTLTSFFKARGQVIPYKNFHTENGIPSNEAYHIHEDQQGFIWICTDKGVVRYDGQNFRLFSSLDGLVSNTIFYATTDQLGRTWFLSLENKLCYYYENKIFPHPLNDKIKQLVPKIALIPSIAINENGGLFFSVDSRSNYTNNKTYYYIAPDSDSIQHYAISDFTPKKQTYVEVLPNQYLLLGVQHYLGSATTKDSLELRKNSNSFSLGRTGSYSSVLLKNKSLLCFNQRQVYLVDSNKTHISYSTIIPNSAGDLIKVYEDDQANLWFATTKGILLYPNGDLTQTPDHYFQDFSITSVLISSDGTLWFSTLADGIFMVPDIHARTYFTIANQASKNNSFVDCISFDSLHFAISKSGAIYQLYGYQLPKLVLETSPKYIHYATKNHQNKLVLSNGAIVDPQQIEKVQYKEDIRQNYGSLKSILVDSIGQYWLALSQGLRSPKNIKNYPVPYRVYDMISHKDHFLLGSIEGLLKYIPKDNTFHPFSHSNKAFKERISSIAITQTEQLFIGTSGAGLLIPTSDTTSLQFTPTEGLSSAFIKSIHIENDSVVWVSSIKGVDRLLFFKNFQLKDITTYSTNNILPSSVCNAVCTSKEKVWIATDNGIVSFRNPLIETQPSKQKQLLHFLSVRANDRIIMPQEHLNYQENYLEFEFINIQFKSPNTTYAYRLKGLDTTWRFSKIPNVSYASLPPGNYELSIGTLLPDQSVYIAPEVFKFSIIPHFSQTWWFYSSISLLVLITISFIIWSKVKHNQLEKQKIKAEQKALYNQIKPHFIFNAMNSILYFIEDNNAKAASLYLRSFSKLLRTVLHNSQKDLVTIAIEYEALKVYLQVEQLRMDDSSIFKHQFILAPIPNNCSAYQIPPMLIQPLIENAILHGLAAKKGNRRLAIRLQETKNSLILRVEDNGIGRIAAKKISAKRIHHTPTGIRNIEQRLHTLSLLYKKTFKLTIEDLEEGTASIIEFPKIL